MSVIMLMLLTSMIAPENVKDPVSADPSVLGKTKNIYVSIKKKFLTTSLRGHQN